MFVNDYQQDVMRTESRLESLVLDAQMCRVLHSMLGIVSEAGEMADILKRHFFYGQEFDKVHFAEELGDGSWYTAIGADALGFPLANVFAAIIAKLRKRMPEAFDKDLVAEPARDRAAERQAMLDALFAGQTIA